MKILIACEESQAVCKEFRARGLEAYSCDIQDCSGGRPEWHIKGDVLEVIRSQKWGAMIAFPPCTHLALSGAAWFEKKRANGKQREGIEFFMQILNAPIPIIAVENPMGIISGGEYIKQYFPDLSKKYGLPIKYKQVIQPYFFGDSAQKSTCIWLKNFPPLYHNDRPNLFDQTVTHVDPGEFFEWECTTTGKTKRQPLWFKEARNNGKVRSKTFPGIANAMADQWGEYLKNKVAQ